MEKIFPTLLIIIDVLAAIVYIIKGDFKHFVYWMAAAILTFSVTWM
jgi:hypothetical protein